MLHKNFSKKKSKQFFEYFKVVKKLPIQRWYQLNLSTSSFQVIFLFLINNFFSEQNELLNVVIYVFLV